MGKDRRAVELRKFLSGHWGKGIGFPMYPALQQSGHPDWTSYRSLNSPEFSHWLIMPAHDNHVALFGPVNIALEVGLRILNVD